MKQESCAVSIVTWRITLRYNSTSWTFCKSEKCHLHFQAKRDFSHNLRVLVLFTRNSTEFFLLRQLFIIESITIITNPQHLKYFTVFSSYALFWMFHNKVLPHKVKFSSTLENFIVYTKKKHEINLKFTIHSTHVKRNQFPWIRMFYILWATNNVYVLVYSFFYIWTHLFFQSWTHLWN